MSQNKKPSSPSQLASIRVQVDVPAGVHLNVTVEARDENGALLETRDLEFNNPLTPEKPASEEAAEAVLAEIQAPPAPVSKPARQPKGFPAALFPAIKLKPTLERLWRPVPWDWEMSLFGLAVFIYLITRLISLDAFPIYFFTDEAVQTVLASDFVRDDFHNYDKELLPTYFENGNQYNLSTSVYLQVLPYLVFGKSIIMTRGVSVLVTLLAAISIGLVFKNVFKTRYYWLATLFLSITPAWFLHSRTAFETALGTTFFCGFLYFYMLYRTGSMRSLYWAVAMGALCFYSYSPAQMVMAVAAVLLFFSDLRYHWKNRVTLLPAFLLALLLALPYARFMIVHGSGNYNHLVILDSYWVQNIPLSQKLTTFGKQYLQGLNPAYWYLPNDLDFGRHLMKGYGNVLRLTLPFALLGLALAFRRIRTSAYRTVLAAVIAAPAGAALVEIGITRALFMVIPLAMLTTLGAVQVMEWLGKLKLSPKLLAGIAFVPLAAFNIYMLYDGLTNGPTWYHDYGLGGMQYGAKQIFSAIDQTLEDAPNTKIILSPAWANGTDVTVRFFFDDPQPFELGSIEGYLNERKPLDKNTLFIMIPQEYNEIKDNPKFQDIRVERIMPDPDGTPGFYFVRLRYSDNFDAILAKETEARKALREADVTLTDGTIAHVQYSNMDMGQIQNLFDGDMNSLVRTYESNPMVIDLTFSTPRTLESTAVKVGGVASRITVNLYNGNDTPVASFTKEVDATPDPRIVLLEFGKKITVTRLRYQIWSVNDQEPAHIHAWEIMVK